MAAKSLGFGLRLHADQFTADFAAPLAAELGAATADHLEATTEVGLRALQAANVQPVLLPASVYTLGLNALSGGAAHDRTGDAGGARDRFQSRLFTHRVDAYGACRSRARRLKMTPAEAITAATINARL